MRGGGWIWILMASIFFFLLFAYNRPGMDEMETVDVVVSIRLMRVTAQIEFLALFFHRVIYRDFIIFSLFK